MIDRDRSDELIALVQAAAEGSTVLVPRGGGSKDFLGRMTQGETLSLSGHCGIVSYEPTELTLTARSGTPLEELEAALADNGQALAFEPPHYGPGATLGGTIAAGVSGPARPYAGAARDFVLGTRVINGRGESLRFGGEVMKNVAGFDVSRLLTGSMGTLGVLLDVSLKVLPRAAVSVTRCFEIDAGDAIKTMSTWASRPLPISAACHHEGVLRLRLSGSASGVRTAAERLGGDSDEAGPRFWRELRDQQLPFFEDETPLWRLSVPPSAAPLALPGRVIVDWGGALRWLKSDADASSVRSVAASVGGHACLFRGGDRRGEVNHPLAPGVLKLHERLKKAFDPNGIFSPGRLYPEF